MNGRLRRLAALAFFAFGAACVLTPTQEAHFPCSIDSDCPTSQHCLQGYCYAPGKGPNATGGGTTGGGGADGG